MIVNVMINVKQQPVVLIRPRQTQLILIHVSLIMKTNKKLDSEEEDDENYLKLPPAHDQIPIASIDIPPLNGTQEKTASSFLDGPSQNLSLVQGPPGTRKTTFMTAVLCRTFLINYSPKKTHCGIDHEKRVLVSAPTNKAISVLPSRFLRAMTKKWILA